VPLNNPSGGSFSRKPLLLLIPLLISLGCSFIPAGLGWGAKPNLEDHDIEVVVRVLTPTLVPTFTPTPLDRLPTAGPTATPTPLQPTPTNTRVVTFGTDPAATAQAAEQATRQAEQKTLVMAQLQAPDQPATLSRTTPRLSFSRESRLVLAHYFAWYDGDGWNDCNISGGDQPAQPYDSDDPAAIARHIEMARQAGLNGFTLHWFGPGDRTDRNFRTLLTQSEGVSFASTVVFSYHFWPGAAGHDQQSIGDALRYILDQYGDHPNFLRVDNQPVIFFIDVYRTPQTGQTPQQFWAAVRDQVDPGRKMWWIAEGLDPSYLSVFDGLYVFKISHAAYPHDYEKNPRWSSRVRDQARQTGQPKLWIATISPGWDDLRAGCKPDVRVPNTSHRLDRADGAIYEATFKAALAGDPDWLLVSSFNEWVEGSYIEPSLIYGDKYMQMTQEFVRRFRSR
jgi:hypothetical protein